MSKTKVTKQPKSNATPNAEKKSNAGRPAGGGEAYDLNALPEREATVTRCKKCGSTKRSPYFGITRVEYAGRVIVRKRTRCLAEGCGQLRIDRYEEPMTKND